MINIGEWHGELNNGEWPIILCNDLGNCEEDLNVSDRLTNAGNIEEMQDSLDMMLSDVFKLNEDVKKRGQMSQEVCKFLDGRGWEA